MPNYIWQNCFKNSEAKQEVKDASETMPGTSSPLYFTSPSQDG